jgi:hypothetical protein
MKLLLATLATLFISTQASFAYPVHVMEKLVKREGIENLKVVYADWDTENFFENEVPWGTRAAWGAIENPFTDGEMPLAKFLETFQLLVPVKGAEGVKCVELYNAGTLITPENATIQKCTVDYGQFQLDMIVKDYSIGNAVEDSDILPVAVGLRVVK